MEHLNLGMRTVKSNIMNEAADENINLFLKHNLGKALNLMSSVLKYF